MLEPELYLWAIATDAREGARVLAEDEHADLTYPMTVKGRRVFQPHWRGERSTAWISGS